MWATPHQHFIKKKIVKLFVFIAIEKTNDNYSNFLF